MDFFDNVCLLIGFSLNVKAAILIFIPGVRLFHLLRKGNQVFIYNLVHS